MAGGRSECVHWRFASEFCRANFFLHFFSSFCLASGARPSLAVTNETNCMKERRVTNWPVVVCAVRRDGRAESGRRARLSRSSVPTRLSVCPANCPALRPAWSAERPSRARRRAGSAWPARVPSCQLRAVSCKSRAALQLATSKRLLDNTENFHTEANLKSGSHNGPKTRQQPAVVTTAAATIETQQQPQ